MHGSATSEEICELLAHCRVELAPLFDDPAFNAAYAQKVAERAELFVGRSGGVLDGICAVYAYEPDSRRGFFTLLVVRHEARGSGLGRRLMTEAMDYLAAHGFEIAALEVLRSNARAIRLHESLGFVPVGAHGIMIEMEARLVGRERPGRAGEAPATA